MSGPSGNRILRMSYLAAGLGGVGFFAMSVLTLGIWPGAVLEEEITRSAPEIVLPLTASEQRGREIYAREGCAYCHTQQIRHTQADVERFGRAVIAWETELDYPHLWGTRRIGPDLAREASVRSEDWQRAHLFSPRAVARDSVMPAYPYLFRGSPDQPTQEGRDLLAYLDTLGKARAMAGAEGETKAREACDCPADLAAMEFDGPLNARASKPMDRDEAEQDTAMPVLDLADADRARGAELFAQDCAGCHGPNGAGDGPASAWLHPAPKDLTEHRFTTEDLTLALWAGVEGTAMPAWRDYSRDEMSDVAAFVAGLGQQGEGPEIPDDLLTLGEEVYQARCAQCHGDNGFGDGFAADSFAIRPTNFHAEQPSYVASTEALREGVDGTRMARWDDELTDAELTAVAAYVRTFFNQGDGQ